MSPSGRPPNSRPVPDSRMDSPKVRLNITIIDTGLSWPFLSGEGQVLVDVNLEGKVNWYYAPARPGPALCEISITKVTQEEFDQLLHEAKEELGL